MDHQIAGARQRVGIARRVGQRVVARRVDVAVQHQHHRERPFALGHVHKAVDRQTIAGVGDQGAGEGVGDVQHFLDLQLALAVSAGGEAVDRELGKGIGSGRRGGGGCRSRRWRGGRGLGWQACGGMSGCARRGRSGGLAGRRRARRARRLCHRHRAGGLPTAGAGRHDQRQAKDRPASSQRMRCVLLNFRLVIIVVMLHAPYNKDTDPNRCMLFRLQRNRQSQDSTRCCEVVSNDDVRGCFPSFPLP